MCLIVLKRNEKSVFTNRQFKNMICRNSDGLGMMWLEEGRVKTEKCMGDDAAKFEMFRKHRDRPTYIMHARMRTHGLINEANCHPYELLNKDKGDPIDLYVMHNGVLDAPSIDKDMSDTWHYMEYIIKPLAKADPNLLYGNEHVQKMITKAIGGSKLVFLSSSEMKLPILMLNSNMGNDETGCWLSNTYGCSTPYTQTRAVHIPYRSPYNPTTSDYSWVDKRTIWDSGSNGWVTREQKDAIDAAKEQRVTDDAEINAYYSEDNWRNDHETFLLTDQSKKKPEDNVVILKPKKNLIGAKPDLLLLAELRQLRGMSEGTIKAYIKDDPDTAADIIMGLCAKTTLSYAKITNLIKTPRGLDDMVNLIRNMVSDEEKLKTGRV